jgi:hypothetical protein
MADALVIFKPAKVSEGNWQIVCHGPGAKIDYVTGFLDEQSIKNWLASEHGDVPIAVELRRADVAGMNVTRPS